MSSMAIAAGRRRRQRIRHLKLLALVLLTLVAYLCSLTLGMSTFSVTEVMQVALGQHVPGASFTVGELRLPRATMAVLAGASFGIAGITFQKLLRNPLAAPDIIGISAGAATAAVAGIVIFSFNDSVVALIALVAALATAATVYLLSHKSGFAGTRLILIGIATAAFLDSITAYLLSKAAEWDIQSAMHWLAGSLNGMTWSRVTPLAVALVLTTPLLLLAGRNLDILDMGDDMAGALGVPIGFTRLLMGVGAVILLAVATAACGPIAFIALMAGPIAARVMHSNTELLIPAALIGALLVLVADFIGKNAFENAFPVGVVTGALGAPFLLLLLARANTSGRSL